MTDDIPLRVLICDAEVSSAKTLEHALQNIQGVQSVKVATNLAEAWTVLSTTTVNAICIDLLSVGLDEGSAFVFRVRETWPEIVFVLYINKATAERQRSTFYKGERSRFSHYYTLDKQTPVAMFADEVGAMVATCQNYLSFSTSAAGLAQLRQEAQQLRHQELSQQEASIVEQLQALMAKMSGELERRTEPRLQRKVFLSHRFAEKEYVDGLCRLLEESGFEVITGRSANTYISKAIIERIHNCDFFLLLVYYHRS
jgi:CheY-like chemotaxis protein